MTNEILVEKDVVMKSPSQIKPYGRNARRNDKTVDLLCQIIPLVGFNVPIVIDAEGVIVKGHARWKAAKRLKLKKVPCIITHADKEAIRADRIADNKISEFSEWINEEVQHELDMISPDFQFNFDDVGMQRMTFDDIPEIDDFEQDEYEADQQIDDEERRRRYEEYLRKLEQESEEDVQIETQQSIKRAAAAEKEVAKAPPKYYEVTCEDCGHKMYVREGDAQYYD